jgi:DnaA regulatory inactivator Hda
VQRQLTLDLGTPPPSTFDNFHTGANAELVARLSGLDAALAAGPVADRTFYVWGESGNGRSHLLHALVHAAPPGHARYLGPQSALAAFGFDPRVAIYAVDDCNALSGAQQIALFNLFNEVRAHPTCALVATGDAAPMGLAVREDLRTRLGWGLVFHLAPLADDGKAAVLKRAARERGIALADGVPAYLLTHFRRDMPSLMALLDALDRFSLEQKRAVTLPLLRTMLAAGLPAQGGAAEAAAGPGFPGDTVATTGVEDELDLLADAPTTQSADAAGEEVRSTESGFAANRATRHESARAAQPAPFAAPTDNVDGELGARFSEVVERELGGALTGEVEADVSNELNGELNGETGETGDVVDTPNAAAPTNTPDATAEPRATAQAPADLPDAATSGPQARTAPTAQPAPQTSTGNGFIRFK